MQHFVNTVQPLIIFRLEAYIKRLKIKKKNLVKMKSFKKQVRSFTYIITQSRNKKQLYNRRFSQVYRSVSQSEFHGMLGVPREIVEQIDNYLKQRNKL
jgi:hypothetical protein